MLDFAAASCQVSLHVGDVALPAVALELSGHRAAVRSAGALSVDSDVSLRIDWSGGSSTSLPGRVCSVARGGHGDFLSHVEFSGVEGDWTSFLEFLGPTAFAS